MITEKRATTVEIADQMEAINTDRNLNLENDNRDDARASVRYR